MIPPLWFAFACSTPSDSADPADSGEPADSADTAADTGDPDTGDTGETGVDTGDTAGDTADTGEDPDTGAPAWPASSVCLGSISSGYCEAGMSAESWDGATAWEWVPDRTLMGSEVRRDGVAVFEVAAGRWFEISGLAEAADGDLYLAGSTTGPSELDVDGARLALTESYPRFLLKVSPSGEVRWVREFGDITVESMGVAPTADGGAIVVGELYTYDVEIGSFLLLGAEWVASTLAARVDAHGAWRWAVAVPSSATPPGEVQYLSIEASGSSDVWIHGAARGTVTVGSDTLPCGGASCPAMVTMTADGDFLGVVPE